MITVSNFLLIQTNTIQTKITALNKDGKLSFKLLNVIAVGLRQSDNINPMITVSNFLLIQTNTIQTKITALNKDGKLS
jgi:hypothetical protein